jgi:hypothetical protein
MAKDGTLPPNPLDLQQTNNQSMQYTQTFQQPAPDPLVQHLLEDVERLQKRQFEESASTQASIPTFNGNVQMLSEFLERFDVVAGAYNWTDAEKCQRFPLYLRGYASDVYHSMTAQVRGQFRNMKQQFCQDIGNTEACKLFSQQLRLRRQFPNETVTMFASDLRKLSKKAYPDMADDARNTYLKDSFLFGVREDIKHELLGKELASLDEAVRIASCLEMRLQYLLPTMATANPQNPSPTTGDKDIANLTEAVHDLTKLSIAREKDLAQNNIAALTNAINALQNNLTQPPPAPTPYAHTTAPFPTYQRTRLNSRGDIFCNYCKRYGHDFSSCRTRIRNQSYQQVPDTRIPRFYPHGQQVQQ